MSTVAWRCHDVTGFTFCCQQEARWRWLVTWGRCVTDTQETQTETFHSEVSLSLTAAGSGSCWFNDACKENRVTLPVRVCALSGFQRASKRPKSDQKSDNKQVRLTSETKQGWFLWENLRKTNKRNLKFWSSEALCAECSDPTRLTVGAALPWSRCVDVSDVSAHSYNDRQLFAKHQTHSERLSPARPGSARHEAQVSLFYLNRV